ncbi:MAG: hypothetical protein DHS20C09_18030 [marine bacterium B5-7]|nr:MAG: hypothetical protein DHS20C09_18030 [marine bacterium B5-7]
MRSWFENYQKLADAIDVRAHVLSIEKTALFEEFLVSNIPNCYITNEQLAARMKATGSTASQILQNKIPDPGNVMAGDFGEVTTLFFLGSERNEIVNHIMKWQYKQDRTKAAPHSDVVILHREDAEQASTNDFVICAESKLKSTNSTFSPIESSIVGYKSDKTGRLARTLVWLKEKEIDHGNLESIAFIERFTDEHLDTEYSKYFRAVAIIDRSFIDAELSKVLELPDQNDEFEIIVLGISDLKVLYERTYERAVAEVTSG